uniref:Protein LIKE COV 1-like n=1 Tax=Ananas comosus var. bracteatus TaxID=296719 RepID=A0A6V7QJQ0_ANACO|nr:unnamed protein product [Ananas comosus var. bracteatus]
MGEEKPPPPPPPSSSSSSSMIAMASRERERERELLIPVADADDSDPNPSAAAAAHRSSGAEVKRWCLCYRGLLSVILFPIAITFYITWWFVHFVDGFFSPIYANLGISIFGLGFVTSITFIFLVGCSCPPGLEHPHLASESGSPLTLSSYTDQNTQAFKEVAVIRHPRIGEYAFGFITSTVVLQTDSGEEELCCVYVPTNHLYIGDIFLVNSKDVIRPNLSVREGIDCSLGGMSMPQVLSTLIPNSIHADKTRRSRS